MKFGRPASDRSQMSLTDRLFAYRESLRPGDRLLFSLALIVLFASLIWIATTASRDANTDVPASGGTLVEGIVGTPRFINPVLAVTRADKDMSSLIYAGLARLNTQGEIVPDIAESVTVSDDGLVYNVVLRSDAVFHDGEPVTAEDVAFTVAQIQNPMLASPLRASWDGVTVEMLGEYELNFVLADPYAPFIENLTVGILPRHIWVDASGEEFPFSQYNSEPIGAGPYQIERIVRNNSGIPQSYVLEPHDAYHRATPRIANFTLKFYTNENLLIDAFNAGGIDSLAGIAPESLDRLAYETETHTLRTTPLPRTFAVFFNQNKSMALRDLAAREALAAVIDREVLIEAALAGYGQPLTSPIPPGFSIDTTVGTTSNDSLEAARAILENGGWQLNDTTGIWEKEVDDSTISLTFSVATANNTVFSTTAEYLQSRWRTLGADVTIRQFEQSDLTQAVIRPRDYDALLFGTVLGRALDLYSFWHSSQRNDPGLNVALYANITSDSLLSTARTSASSTVRATAAQDFADEVATEAPAVFLYSPEMLYVLPTHVQNVTLTGVAEPQERFMNVAEWYIDTDAVWPLFQN